LCRWCFVVDALEADVSGVDEASGAGEADPRWRWWCFEVGAPEAVAAGDADAPGAGDADPKRWK
jgi:hypothetical protein